MKEKETPKNTNLHKLRAMGKNVDKNFGAVGKKTAEKKSK